MRSNTQHTKADPGEQSPTACPGRAAEYINGRLIEDDGGPLPKRTRRPYGLGSLSPAVSDGIQLCDRIEAAAIELRRQMLTEEIDTDFIPADVLRALHRFVMADPETTVAAVVSQAVGLLFRNYLNLEEIAPEVAAMIRSTPAPRQLTLADLDFSDDDEWPDETVTLTGNPFGPDPFGEPGDDADPWQDEVAAVMGDPAPAEPPAEPAPPNDLDDTPQATAAEPVAEPIVWADVPVEPLDETTWEKCRAVLPAPKERGRRPTVEPRNAVTVLAHRWRTGCPWHELPAELGPWPTFYAIARGWMIDGTYRKLRAILCDGRPAAR